MDIPTLTASPQPPPWRTRAFDESPALLEQAVEMLSSAKSTLALTAAEAHLALAQMRLVSCSTGTQLFREGERTRSDHMLFLLEGEVSVDTGKGSPANMTSISVLGPGSMIGEMAMLDGAPRSASCTAVSAVQAAGMSRLGLERLLEQHPRVAAKLLAMVALVTAERLRALNEQLRLYAQLNTHLREEIDAKGRQFQRTL